jgi:hypothetical protein
MGRERRDFVRRSGVRDARLFVIATEGYVSEPKYFNGLKERWHNPRIHIDHFLPHTSRATARSKALDTRPAERWPSGLGTRVYRLVEQLQPTSG